MSKYVENGLYVLLKVWFLTGSKGIFVSARNLLFFFPFWVWGKVIVFCLRETELHPIFFFWTGERVNFFFLAGKREQFKYHSLRFSLFLVEQESIMFFLGCKERESQASWVSFQEKWILFFFDWLQFYSVCIKETQCLSSSPSDSFREEARIFWWESTSFIVSKTRTFFFFSVLRETEV